MTLATVRAAAIDRALVGDDAESALALAGVVDGVVRGTTDDRLRAGRTTAGRSQAADTAAETTADPFTAAMIAIGCLGTTGAPLDRALDERAWRPGRDADPLVVAGAAVAVRERDVAVDRAAALADCAPATLEAVVDRQRREKER